jgi:hypothetical protein
MKRERAYGEGVRKVLSHPLLSPEVRGISILDV